jgi:O-antigen ligase
MAFTRNSGATPTIHHPGKVAWTRCEPIGMNALVAIVAAGYIAFAVLNVFRRPGFFASAFLLSYGLTPFWGPLGATFGLVAIAASLVALNAQKQAFTILPCEVPLIAWTTMMFLSLFYTPQIRITGEYLALLTILSLGTYIFARTFALTPGFFQDLFFSSLLLDIISATKLFRSAKGAFMLGQAEGLQHVGLASMAEVCLLGILVYLLFHRNHSRWITIGLLLYLAFFLIPFTVALGTRSVFLSVGLTFVFMLLAHVWDGGARHTLIWLAGIAAAVTGAAILFWNSLMNSPIAFVLSKGGMRLINGLLSGGISTDPSAQGRLNFYHDAYELFLLHPIFGYGAGAFGYLADNAVGGYPHNMILELLVEGGVVGLLLFSAFFMPLAFRGLVSVFYRPVAWTAVFPFAFLMSALIRHQVSDSILSGKTLFMSLGILAATWVRESNNAAVAETESDPHPEQVR